MEDMTLAQTETVELIFNLLTTVWGSILLFKARRLSMSLSKKRMISKVIQLFLEHCFKNQVSSKE